MSKKGHEEPEDDWMNSAAQIPQTFPNGMPRWVTWYEVQDGVRYVTVGGVQHFIWSDHRLHVDVKKTCCFFHEWMAPDYEGGPMKEHSVSSYENSEEEAFWSAYYEQQRLEREGEFVPIFVRD